MLGVMGSYGSGHCYVRSLITLAVAVVVLRLTNIFSSSEYILASVSGVFRSILNPYLGSINSAEQTTVT